MKKFFKEFLIWTAICFVLVASILFMHIVIGINMLEPITLEFKL